MGELTDEQLDELEALHAAATPGPWFGSGCHVVTDDGICLAECYGYLETGESEEDADYISMACNLAPALVAEVRRLRAKVGILEAEHD